ncbi:nucleotidyltransferase MB21D2-like [Mercenaria mercenaria]|uniref:nucleotidyltransferase MB21D2-like n=1 Tax=Mercenaria mercenaria TaxID=6596 RepID=UPI00234E514A|nr:nucleotidyltransferase MB21D2-like [Mercenaria mercenaria]
MSKNEDRELSLLICSTLDTFGFKKQNVSMRSKYLEEDVNCLFGTLEKIGNPYMVTVVGSSGEGVQLSDSDTDLMSVIRDVVCVDKGCINENFTVLETDYTYTAPGYTKVVSTYIPRISAVNNFQTSPIFYFSCMYDTLARYPYISSEKIRNLYRHIDSPLSGIVKHDWPYETATNGPAFTVTGTDTSRFDNDNVFSICFYGGEYLKKWANRTRFCTWSSCEIVKEISEMEGYIVPIGDKESDNQNIEWRICYTTAEKKLVSSLSDIQMKMYVLLKMVTKTLLKPKCKALTSYVVKNVIFWIVERTHAREFSPDLLVNLIQKSLHLIKCFLENNHFPNYMIPERNLLRGAVYGQEKRDLIHFLSACLQEGRTILLKIPKLYHCVSLMVTNPDNMIMYGKWRKDKYLKILTYVIQQLMI